MESSQTKLSSKNQITLPAALCRELGWKSGAPIVVQRMNDCIVLLPKPQSVIDAYQGLLGGSFKTAEEMDRYVREERDAWDR